MAVCALSQGKMKEADEILTKYIAKRKELGTSESRLEGFLGGIYMRANIIDQAEIHYRKAYKLNPQNVDRIYELVYFLINKDINVTEGMELVEKAMAILPDNLVLLRLKGRGLYKQGKYEEAVQLLRKVQESWSEANYDLSIWLPEAEQALANQNK
jgi:tetratricopeptide (TPR) repeat protein